MRAPNAGPGGSADDLQPFRARKRLKLFELACLLHERDPARVIEEVFDEMMAHDTETAGRDVARALSAPAILAGRIDATPCITLGDELGTTLLALKKAAACLSWAEVSMPEARRLAALLGRPLLPSMMGIESVETRQQRRLARFLELGGALKDTSIGWRLGGRRGALADLEREEKRDGRVMSDRTDVSDDLKKAAAQLGS